MDKAFIRTRMRASQRWDKGLRDLLRDVPGTGRFLRVIEIGCYAGESFRVFAASGRVRDFIAVDPWVLQYATSEAAERDECGFVEAEKAFDEAVREYPDVLVTKVIMRSKDAAVGVPNALFDLVYVDGSHDYETVREDIALYLPKLKKGGVMAGHDYRSSWTGVTRAVDEAFPKLDKIYEDTSWMKRI